MITVNFLAQTILAARNRDSEGWMNILFIVVLAVFYAVGSIVKARANKLKSREQEEERPGRKPGFKPAKAGRQGARAFQKTPLRQAQRPVGRIPPKESRTPLQLPRRKVMRPQPAAQEFAAKTEQATRLGIIQAQEEPKLSPLVPQLQPEFEELPELPEIAVKPIKKLKDKHIGFLAETPGPEYLSELLLDYADPDELRRAILHYEILGKPLSLRNPSE